MDFTEAVALSWRIRTAGYAVEALYCGEEGRIAGWSVVFRGATGDARVYRVWSVAEWERWLAEQ